MNGKLIGRKPLYVAVAQRKEERRARLQVRAMFTIYFWCTNIISSTKSNLILVGQSSY